MTRKLKILFLCMGNSCRSQMAEAGVDISSHRTKLVDEFKNWTWVPSSRSAVMPMRRVPIFRLDVK